MTKFLRTDSSKNLNLLQNRNFLNFNLKRESEILILKGNRDSTKCFYDTIHNAMDVDNVSISEVKKIERY